MGGQVLIAALPLTFLRDVSVNKPDLGTFLKKGKLFENKGERTKKIKMSSYLKVICFIVVHVQSPVQLTVSGYRQLFSTGDSIVDGLPRILLHLNVVKLTEIAKPLDELRGNASVELLNLNSERDKNTAIFLIYSLSIRSIFQVPLPSVLRKVCF